MKPLYLVHVVKLTDKMVLFTEMVSRFAILSTSSLIRLIYIRGSSEKYRAKLMKSSQSSFVCSKSYELNKYVVTCANRCASRIFLHQVSCVVDFAHLAKSTA